MLLIFPLIYVLAFAASLRELYRGNNGGILIYMIFGLSMYLTVMPIIFTNGLGFLVPFFQYFKEILVFLVLILNIVGLKYKPRFHLIDYLVFGYLAYNVIYAILPIGQQGFTDRLLALKGTSFFIMVYFAGRLVDPRTVFISKYLNYLVMLTLAAGIVVLGEVILYQHLQSITGYADYSLYFFNYEPTGSYGLSTTFESEGGYKRFGSFFANPLEHAAATIIAVSAILALYTRDDNKFKINNIGMAALVASVISIIFALSRAPLVAYILVIYFYAVITRQKMLVTAFNAFGVLLVIYIIYLFSGLGGAKTGLVEVLMNTIDFSNPSSVGHLVEWLAGINAIYENPLGLGLGSSGRLAASLGDNTGGENQFIVIGVQTGILTLLAYLAVYIMFIKTSMKSLSYLTGKERQICLLVFLMKIGLLIPSLTSEVESSSYISYMEWFLSGLLMSIIMRPREDIKTQIVDP